MSTPVLPQLLHMASSDTAPLAAPPVGGPAPPRRRIEGTLEERWPPSAGGVAKPAAKGRPPRLPVGVPAGRPALGPRISPTAGGAAAETRECPTTIGPGGQAWDAPSPGAGRAMDVDVLLVLLGEPTRTPVDRAALAVNDVGDRAGTYEATAAGAITEVRGCTGAETE